MKTTMIGLIAALFLAATSIAGGPPENDFKALFPKHWQVSKDFTLAVAEAMPAEFYDFKPNPQEMSFGEMMMRLAQSNSEWLFRRCRSSIPTSWRSRFRGHADHLFRADGDQIGAKRRWSFASCTTLTQIVKKVIIIVSSPYVVARFACAKFAQAPRLWLASHCASKR
jgi:hypothetical protein